MSIPNRFRSYRAVTGRPFLGMDTANAELKWLFIQSENSNRRLQADLDRLRVWLGESDWGKFCERVRFHTIENDEDGFLSIDNPDNLAAIEAEIQSFGTGVVVFDPLNEKCDGPLIATRPSTLGCNGSWLLPTLT